MNDKDMKKLSRADLLEMLIDQQHEVEELKKKLQDAEEKLRNREIVLQNAGSIAEASLQLNGVFEAAEEACQQYMENIKKHSAQQEEICKRMEAESAQRAEKMIADAVKKSEKLEADTKMRCAEMMMNARAESKAYWDELTVKLEQFYDEHVGLKELLSIVQH